MREHMGLFHGKRKDSGEWVEGSLFLRKDTTGKVFEAFIVEDAYEQILYWQRYIRSNLTSECYRIDPDTVGECTGLKDKNGKLIFEGDILEREYLGEKHRYTVVYSRAAFAWGEKNKYGLTGRFGKGIGTVEIIGNIYDNPELLEEESEKK